jgi:serine protease Do
MRPRPVAIAAFLLLLVAAACGPSAGPATPSSPSSPSTGGPPSTGPSADPLQVESIKALADAVIQIEAAGTFRDPTEGEFQGTFRGSGFIIDPSGIAVTNNHVVTGANTVTVWVGPDRSEHSATVLGASECSDLAVIKIAGLGQSRYLTWYTGDIAPGLDIYAAGFPLGEPEFTLTKGIVSRAHGLLDENWAWVENSIEHDANTNPGSSGGPIVAATGGVVGVHYAGDSETEQHWAIARDEAVALIDDMSAGRDVASIGINGTAVGDMDDDGIWVSSVKKGSPADKVGLQAGDIITDLGGVELAVDGTMKEYCQVLRSHKSDDVLAIDVYRASERNSLRGEINGDPIVPGFSFLTALGTKLPAGTPPSFEPVETDAGVISFEAPSEWSDIVENTWTLGGTVVGSSVLASEDAATFKSGWTTPGIYVAASDTLAQSRTVGQVLDGERGKFGKCRLEGRETFTRAGYSGVYDVWKSCGGAASSFLTVAAVREDEEMMVYVQLEAVAASDLAALDRFFATFEANP